MFSGEIVLTKYRPKPVLYRDKETIKVRNQSNAWIKSNWFKINLNNIINLYFMLGYNSGGYKRK